MLAADATAMVMEDIGRMRKDGKADKLFGGRNITESKRIRRHLRHRRPEDVIRLFFKRPSFVDLVSEGIALENKGSNQCTKCVSPWSVGSRVRTPSAQEFRSLL